jgi:hypothetical protein
MLTLSVIIEVMVIMSKYKQEESAYQKQVKNDFVQALEEENLEWLDGLMEGLVKSCKKVPKMPKLEDTRLYQLQDPIKESGESSKIMSKLINQTLCQSPEDKEEAVWHREPQNL